MWPYRKKVNKVKGTNKRYNEANPVVTIRICRATKDRLLIEAKEKGMSLSEIIRSILQSVEANKGTKPNIQPADIQETITRLKKNNNILRDKLSKKNSEYETLSKQFEWACYELDSNDKANRKIAEDLADTYELSIHFAHTNWDNLP